LADDISLYDPVVALIFDHFFEEIVAHAHAPFIDRGGNAGLLVEDGAGKSFAVRRDGFHDQIIVARSIVDHRFAPDAACFAGTIDNPEHEFRAKIVQQDFHVSDGLAGARRIAARQGRLAIGQEPRGILGRGVDLRFPQNIGVIGGKRFRQNLRDLRGRLTLR
jgi:hypothetical protein